MVLKSLSILLIMFALSACGGGGGGSTSSSPSSGGADGGSGGGMEPEMDVTPDAFGFSPQSDQEPNILVTSEPITVTGINSEATLTVTGGRVSINGSSFSSTAAQVNSGDSLQLQVLSNSEFSGTQSVSVTIGDVTETFSVTTRAADISPDPLIFNPVEGAERNAVISSETLTVSGIESSVSVSIAGGLYSINGSAFQSASATVDNGDELQIQLVAPEFLGSTSIATLIIGDNQSSFSISTLDDLENPVAELVYPLGNVLTGNENVIVRGTAADNDAIESVSVNGVAALSDNGFASWTATLPLSFGRNELDIEVQDMSGRQSDVVNTTIIERQAEYDTIDVVVYDASRSLLFIGDEDSEAVFSLDVNSGQRTIVSSASVGEGVSLREIDDMLLSLDGQTLYVLNSLHEEIYAVDISTGARHVLSSEDVGSGTFFEAPYGFSQGRTDNELLVVDWVASGGVLFSVDTTTGNRTEVFSDDIGTGPSFDVTYDTIYDANTGTVYVADSDLEAILAIDIDTGSRTVVTSDLVGAGALLNSPKVMALNPQSGEIYVATDYWVFGEGSVYAILKVDISTGERTVLSGTHQDRMTTTGSGAEFTFVSSIELSPTGDSIFVASLDQLIKVDISSGNREALVQPSGLFSGDFGRPLSATLDAVNNRAIIGSSRDETFYFYSLSTGNAGVLLSLRDEDLDVSNRFDITTVMDDGQSLINASSLLFGDNSFRSYDTTTGTMTLLSGEGVGTGFAIVYEQDMVFDAQRNRLLVSDSWDEHIKTVDLATGNRAAFAGSTVGSGAAINRPRFMALDSSNNRVFVSDIGEDSVYSIDLDSGVRTMISSSFDEFGTGPTMEEPGTLIYDAESQQLIVATRSSGLLSIDVSTGNRTALDISVPWDEDVVIDFANDIALLPNFDSNRLYLVDLRTGERVTVYR